MADYPIVSDVSAYLLQLLRRKMCPEPIPLESSITISTPADADAQCMMGLYLYDMQEDAASAPSMAGSGHARLRRPPKPYSLYYMFFLNSASEMAPRGGNAQKTIGRVAQVVNDGNIVSPRSLQAWLEDEEPPIIFSPAKLSLDEKTKVWSAVGKPYQVSLFYKASPVFLSSEIVVDANPVVEARFNFNVKGEEKGGG